MNNTETNKLSFSFTSNYLSYDYSRAMALSRGIAGEPGGVSVRILDSSRVAVCLTVIVCLKSTGNDICPGSRFKSCNYENFNISLLYANHCLHLQSTLNLFLLNFPRRFFGVGVFCVIIMFSSRPNRSISRASNACSRFFRSSSCCR